MKFIAIGAALLLGLGVSAEAAPVRWQGELTIVSKSGTCDYDPTGDYARVRFRPGIGGENGTLTRLSLFFPRGAHGYVLNGLFTTAFRTVDTMYIGDGFGSYDSPAAVKFTSQSPATITPTTDFIDIRGQIRGYDFMPACIVTFKMVLARRV